MGPIKPIDSNSESNIEFPDGVYYPPRTSPEVTPTETDPKIIALQNEIGERVGMLKTKEPDAWSRAMFNNLKLYLPGKTGKQQFAILKEAGALDMPFDNENGYNSELAKTRTQGDFFSDIAKAVEEYGVDMDRVDKLYASTRSPQVDELDPQQREHGSQKSEHEAELSELFLLLEPVYKKLRTMGYNHYDITGDAREI